VDDQPDFDVLFWVGCAGAFEARAQNIVRSFAKIMEVAGVNYAVLGNNEKCTGDSARRTGNEYLFSMMAEENVETLNSAGVKNIVTTCPHCLHTLKNEYPDFGGNYNVVHHSVFIKNLLEDGKIKLKNKQHTPITYHDPCYLGRHNGVFEAPRENLRAMGFQIVEMKRSYQQSFCCGAGGGQMWKEEEQGKEDTRKHRFNEAEGTSVNMIATSCPFCMTMLGDAGKELDSKTTVKDVAEIIAEQI
jgi:Fe-S oxidoreductase